MGRMLLVALLVMPGGTLRAQAYDVAPFVLQLPASTRAFALGNAYWLPGGDHDAIFYNPARLRSARGAGLSVQRYGSESTLGTASVITGWSSGGLGLGVQVLTYSIQSANVSSLPTQVSDLMAGGGVGASEAVATLAYGRPLLGFDVGASIKLMEQRVGGNHDANLAIDLAALETIGRVTFGVSVQNLGPDISFDNQSRNLPYLVTAGASMSSRPVGPLDLATTGAITVRGDGEVIPRGGVEISWWPIQGRTFIGRIGLQRVPGGDASAVSFGAAFTGDEITIEYGFREIQGSGAAHRFGLRWR